MSEYDYKYDGLDFTESYLVIDAVMELYRSELRYCNAVGTTTKKLEQIEKLWEKLTIQKNGSIEGLKKPSVFWAEVEARLAENN